MTICELGTRKQSAPCHQNQNLILILARLSPTVPTTTQLGINLSLPTFFCAQVPVLEVTPPSGGATVALADSTAIAEYLDAALPGPRLIPTDILVAAAVRRVCAAVASNIQPFQNPATLKRVAALSKQIAPDVDAQVCAYVYICVCVCDDVIV